MSQTHPYVWATSPAEADREFASLDSLVGVIAADYRRAAPADPGMKAISAVVSRGGLPGGRAVAVRVDDGRHAGHGTCLGYAFIPGYDRQAQTLMGALMARRAADRVSA